MVIVRPCPTFQKFYGTRTLVSNNCNDNGGFTVSFRWLIENGEAVLYLYEIQLISLACRIGLGTKLMKLVEKMASKTRMSKVVLTVLVGNTAAIEFYRKLGYTNNEKMPGKCSYRILSKNVKTNPEIELKYTA